MKIAFRDKEQNVRKLVPWLEETRALEAEDREQAINEYQRIVSYYPETEVAYDRLMILYRALKMPKEELRWIDRAVRIFEAKLNKPAIRKNSKIATLSKSLSKSTGLTDRTGQALYRPQPIGRWEKRKALILNKVKSKK